MPADVNRRAKLTHLGGLWASKIDPPATLAFALNSAEERAGVTDGKRVEDPTMGIGWGTQHPVCCAGDGIIAEHDQEVSEGWEAAELPAASATGPA